MPYFALLIVFLFKHSESFKTSMCLHNNEEFSLCGWKCPVTCVNLRLVNRPLKSLCPEKWECHIGCRCAAGYVRDEYSKDCVTIQNCPVSQQLTMKVVSLFVCAYATLAFATPTIRTSLPEYLKDTYGRILREKRSKFGNGYYSYGAGSSSIGSYTPYQWNWPYQNYVNPYGYQAINPGCGRGYYRTEEQNDDREIMSFSDKESEHPVVRNTNEAVATSSNPQLTPLSASMPSIGQLLPPPGGPGYGMFPNGQSAGYNVPLYFSCTPSIVPGRLVRTPSTFGYGNPFGYRGSEDMPYEHLSDEQAVHDNVPKPGDATNVAIMHQ